MGRIKNFLVAESGTQVVENGLVITLIAIAAVASLIAIGTTVADLYSRVRW